MINEFPRGSRDWLRVEHANFHDQIGNMLGRDECGEIQCDFWSVADHVLTAYERAPVGERK